MPEKPDKVVRMPEPARPATAGCVIRIGGQTIRIDLTATDITDAPEAEVISIDDAKPKPTE